MFGKSIFSNPFEQFAGGSYFPQQSIGFGPQPMNIGFPGAGGPSIYPGAFGIPPWSGAQTFGVGPIGSLPGAHPYALASQMAQGYPGAVRNLPQFGLSEQAISPFGGLPGALGSDPFGTGQGQRSQSWGGYADPSSMSGVGSPLQYSEQGGGLASAIPRDPRIGYLAQLASHPLIASNPVLRELVNKELITMTVQQLAFGQTAPFQSPMHGSFGANAQTSTDPFLGALFSRGASGLPWGLAQNVPTMRSTPFGSYGGLNF